MLDVDPLELDSTGAEVDVVWLFVELELGCVTVLLVWLEELLSEVEGSIVVL